jgi:hypothetical protein
MYGRDMHVIAPRTTVIPAKAGTQYTAAFRSRVELDCRAACHPRTPAFTGSPLSRG